MSSLLERFSSLLLTDKLLQQVKDLLSVLPVVLLPHCIEEAFHLDGIGDVLLHLNLALMADDVVPYPVRAF